MRPATYDEVVGLLEARPGAPKYWAGVFVKAKLSLRAVEAYLETSEIDVNSPLRAGKSEFLGKELEDLEAAYGVSETDDKGYKDDVVRYLASTSEQDAITREVSHYATVRFRPVRTAAYSAHVVARSIRMINSRYLLRLVPRGMRILEAGADLKSLIFRPVDFNSYRAAVPAIGVRDVVRHAYIKVCKQTLQSGRHDYRVLERARILLDDPGSVLQHGLVQDCSWQTDCIVTNDASHDIPFGDMPKVMAAKGASMWVGAMMRVKGLSRFSTRTQGEVPVIGAKYVIDSSRDRISFHFKCDASFDYTHKLSEHRKYEEYTDYVFRGGVYDYVYTKLPATTDTTLFFCVYRVPAMPFSMSEPSFADTGSAGKVLIKSVRAVGDEVSGLPRVYEPHEFEMDEEIYEKVAERRQSLGASGNLAMTISYLRSVRVRFYINGEPIGAEHRMGQELIESAAVAIEVVVAENRRSVEASLTAIETARNSAVRNVAGGGVLAKVLTEACDFRRVSGKIKECIDGMWTSVRGKLVQAALSQTHRIVVEVTRQPAYRRIDSLEEQLDVGVVNNGTSGCLCSEKSEVLAALQFGDLTSVQRDELSKYLKHLTLSECSICPRVDDVIESVGRVAIDDQDDEQTFYDASTDFSEADTAVFTCGSTTSESLTTVTGSGPDVPEFARLAMDEYVRLQRHLSKSVKSKVRRDASLIFRDGVPSDVDLLKATTGRISHYAVELVNGELVKVLGGKNPVDLSAVYNPYTMQLLWVTKRGGKAFVSSGESGWVYSSSSLEIFNNDALASAVEVIAEDSTGYYAPVHQSFVQGVPGSGKTYEVKHQMNARKDVVSVLYLSATVSSAEEVRKAVYGDSRVGKVRVRTVDSYTLGAPVTAEEVWVDEACMAHAGQLYAALVRAMPKIVKFYGDFNQIPFCSFTSDSEFKVNYASLHGQMSMTYRSETHRCPQDVCSMWEDRYDEGFFPCKCPSHVDERNARSLSVRYIRSASEISFDKDTRYMVFTQEEKRILHQALGFDAKIETLRLKQNSGLATVHEDQGSTHRKVALVRLIGRFDSKQSSEVPSIYNRLEYALTASTRHKAEFVYYTTSVEEDVLVKRISKAKGL